MGGDYDVIEIRTVLRYHGKFLVSALRRRSSDLYTWLHCFKRYKAWYNPEGEALLLALARRPRAHD